MSGAGVPSGRPAGSDAITVAERVLAETLGATIELAPGKLAGVGHKDFLVSRHEVERGPSQAPPRVVLKRINPEAARRYAPGEPGGLAGSLFDEWAALTLLTELFGRESPAPIFYGGDRDAGLLVMEDLGRGESLVEPLFESDPEAADAALDDYFAVLGRTNAETLGQAERFGSLRHALGPATPRVAASELQRLLGAALAGACQVVALQPPPDAGAEIEAVASIAADPGPFLALSQLDTCPDNCLRAAGRTRLLDFGGGGFFHALNDGARARCNFPTCWSVFRLPERTIERLEEIYRAELARRCPEARDDRRFGEALVAICAFWTLHNLGIFLPRALARDEHQTCASERQKLIERLRLLEGACRRFGHFPALGDVARELGTRLRARWAGTETMPLFPAFRNAAD